MPSALLCETVTGRTMAELVAARDAAVDADMVELRLDGVHDLDVVRALHGRRRPAVVTCRPTWEGGRFDGGEDIRHGILAAALDQGAEYVDVEWRALLMPASASAFASLVTSAPGRVVVSAHDFNGMRADLGGQVREMRSTGASVIKVAVTPSRVSDTLRLRDVAESGDAVVIGMGAAGVQTRLLASRFGSRWTYSGHGVAPGQIPSERMLRAFRFRDVGERTALYAVVGHDAVQSLAPVLFNAAFAAAGLDAVAVPLQVSDYEDFVHFASTFGMAGAAVDSQFGADAKAAAARAEERAARTGVANTVRRAHAGWEAMRTAAAGRSPGESMAASGANAFDGLVWEAEQQFEWWTGQQPRAGVMREAALDELARRATDAPSRDAVSLGSERRRAAAPGVD